MLGKLLDSRQHQTLSDVRSFLASTRSLLEQRGAPATDVATLVETTRQLDDVFLVVVAGEFNAGKSALLNALVGEDLLREGVTPTTDRLHVVRWGDQPGTRLGDGGIEEIESPCEVLRELTLVDTPGTNAIARDHELLTREFVPRADTVLFVTSIDRPFTESERAFLESLRSWGKKIIVVINKVDLHSQSPDGEEAVREVREFVADGCARLLGFSPPIFAVSARRARAASTKAERSTSGIVELEDYLVSTLDEAERFRLKLSNPLAAARKLLDEDVERQVARREILADDFRALDDIEEQLELYAGDMKREFELRLSDCDRRLHQLENRGTAFFDETLRLGRIIELMDKTRLERRFEREVVAELPREIEERVGELIDWMVTSELRQWQGLRARVEKRLESHRDEILGSSADSGLEADRNRLLQTLGRAATSAVEGFDRQDESRRMATAVQRSLAGAALLEAGALGVGSIVTLAATTTAVDVTGLLAAGALATVGLLVLPVRRRRAKAALRERLEKLRRVLMDSLTSEFDGELDRSIARLRNVVGPYSRFVRSERERLERDSAAAGELIAEQARLMAELGAASDEPVTD